MRSDLLDGVIVFTTVAEKRSFTAAASELGVTPASVSWTVKQLERRVGAPLLARTTRSVGLTEAGALFLEHARTGVAHVAAGVDAAQSLGTRPTGLLRLNVPSVAQPLLERVLAGFSAAYPEIELELTMEERFIDIVAEGYDAGIRLGEMIAQDMVAVRLTSPSPLTVVGSPGYFAKRGKPRRPEELAEHDCINTRLVGGGLYQWAFQERVGRGKLRKFEIGVTGPLIVNVSTLNIHAAVSGVGLTYNIGANVDPLVQQGLLEPCLQSFMPESPGFFIYFPSRAQVLPKLRAFLEFWSHLPA